MFRAASPSEDLSVKSTTYFEGSIWILTLMYMAFHSGQNAESLELMQLCSLLFRHKGLFKSRKQVVNVLEDEV